MTAPAFAPGFRFSFLDAVALTVGSVAAVGAGWSLGWMGFFLAFVLGHFFLFCNVFRISRRRELAWAALFVVLAGATTMFAFPGWTATIGASLVLTMVVILSEMREPSYHGVGWRRINPDLRQWWDAQGTD